MTRPLDHTGNASEETPPAAQPSGSEQELARGRVEQTPLSVINWVGVVIGAFALLAVALVVLAYVVA